MRTSILVAFCIFICKIMLAESNYYYDMKGYPIKIEYLPFYSGTISEVGFSEGLCAVYVGSHCCYVTKEGKLAFPEKIFRDGGAFSEGLAYVKDSKNRNYGFIDKKGNYVIPPIYGDAMSFSEGLAPVYSLEKNKWGYIDCYGNVILDFIYYRAYPFKNGFAFVSGEKMGFINFNGDYCSILDTTDIYPETFMISEGVYSYRHSDFSERGYMGIDEKKIIGNKKFKQCRDFTEGLAAVQYYDGKNTFWGFIDRTGEFVIKPQYVDVSNFNGGYAWALIYSKNENNYKSVLIDAKGNIVVETNEIDINYYRGIVRDGVLVFYHRS